MPRIKPTYPVIRVRGGGGAEFDMDVYPAGTRQRELLDEKLAKRQLKVISGQEHLEPEADEPAAPAGVPSGTVDDVLDWVRGAPEGEPAVDGWESRAMEALDVERDAAKPRTSLIDRLSAVLEEATTDG